MKAFNEVFFKIYHISFEPDASYESLCPDFEKKINVGVLIRWICLTKLFPFRKNMEIYAET